MLRKLAIFSTLLIGLAALAGAPAWAQKPLRLVVISHGSADDPFWSTFKNGVDQAAKEVGVTAEYRGQNEGDPAQVPKMLDAAVASKPDGLIVAIADSDAMDASLKAALASGIPVMASNSLGKLSPAQARTMGILMFFGQPEFNAGVAAGERMKKAGVKTAVCVNPAPGVDVLDQRCNGFKEGLGGKVEVINARLDPTFIRTSVTAYLTKNPDIEGVLALGGFAGPPTLAALQETDMLAKKKFGAFDLTQETLQALADHKMMFAVDQQQYLQGYLPVIAMAQYLRNGLLPANDVATGPNFVTPDTAARVIELNKKGIR